MPNTSEDTVYKHLNFINARDEREYLDSVKFPFTYQNYNGVSITIRDEAVSYTHLRAHET
mgnify:CR=1 FL=1